MATIENILKFIPENLQEFAKEFDISDEMLEANADLVILILGSKSISESKEKQSWFDLYPLMNAEQIDKLREILVREKEKLAEIEAKYQARQAEIRKKYETYASGEYQQKQEAIRNNENASRQQEEVEADALLDQI